MHVSDFLVERIENTGIKHIFGVPGDYVLDLYSKFCNSESIEVIGSTDENHAGFAADAIAVPNDPLIQALAWRFRSDETTVVVSGDQATDDKLMVPFASNADLLVHEAHTKNGIEEQASTMAQAKRRALFMNTFPKAHSEVSTAAKVAEQAGAKRLALTALLPTEDEVLLVSSAREHYSGELFVAQPGESLEI